MLFRPASLDFFSDDTLKSTNTHASLSVSGQGIMSGKCIAAKASVGLLAGVNLGMSLEVVSADEALFAMVAPKLPIAQMSLYVGLDVLFPTKLLVAVLIL